MGHSPKKASIVIVLLLAVILASSLPNKAHAQSEPIVGVWSAPRYNSANITDPALTAGSKFAVQINVTNALMGGLIAAWNSYEFVLFYDQRYIAVSSYDISTNTVFGATAFAGPGTYNGPGALRMSVVDEGQAFADSGMLVNITFSVVVAGGVSPLTLAAGMAQTGTGIGPSAAECPGCPPGAPEWTRLTSGSNVIGVETSDGYFKNVAGVSGPTAHFTYTPTNPSQGDTVTFNATNSFDPDNNNTSNHGVATYIWDFGDISDNSILTTTNPVVTHVFAHGGTGGTEFTGNFSIFLTVEDQDQNFMGMQTQLLTVALPPTHCVAVTGVFRAAQISQSQTETVTVQLTDSGTYNESFNLTVVYGPPNVTLAHLTGLTLSPAAIRSFGPFNITTSNLEPALYNLLVTVSLSGSSNCANGFHQTQFQIVPPTGSGNLTLILAGGVGVIATIIIGATVLGRRRTPPEPP